MQDNLLYTKLYIFTLLCLNCNNISLSLSLSTSMSKRSGWIEILLAVKLRIQSFCLLHRRYIHSRKSTLSFCIKCSTVYPQYHLSLILEFYDYYQGRRILWSIKYEMKYYSDNEMFDYIVLFHTPYPVIKSEVRQLFIQNSKRLYYAAYMFCAIPIYQQCVVNPAWVL